MVPCRIGLRYNEALFPGVSLVYFFMLDPGDKEEVSQSLGSFLGSGKGEGKLTFLPIRYGGHTGTVHRFRGVTGFKGHNILNTSWVQGYNKFLGFVN